MLTLIILLWLRKVRDTGETNATFLRQRITKMARLVLPVLAIIPMTAFGQTRIYNYQVVRNHDRIGFVSIIEKTDNQRKTIQLESNIKAKVVFTISVTTKEKTMLENERIVYAESTKKINGNEEVFRKLMSVGNGYEFLTNSKQVQLDNTIIFNNTVSLFVTEPVHSMIVFSDTFHELLLLKKISEHTYLLELPDGNSNTYQYQDGICSEVKVDHKFFTARIVLDQITLK